jgi:hypothetical protein
MMPIGHAENAAFLSYARHFMPWLCGGTVVV